MKEIIETIARAIVDNPDVVSVLEVNGMYTSILKLQVAQGDVGKIIGKKGRTADAIRSILNSISAKGKKRVILEIVD